MLSFFVLTHITATAAAMGSMFANPASARAEDSARKPSQLFKRARGEHLVVDSVLTSDDSVDVFSTATERDVEALVGTTGEIAHDGDGRVPQGRTMAVLTGAFGREKRKHPLLSHMRTILWKYRFSIQAVPSAVCHVNSCCPARSITWWYRGQRCLPDAGRWLLAEQSPGCYMD